MPRILKPADGKVEKYVFEPPQSSRWMIELHGQDQDEAAKTQAAQELTVVGEVDYRLKQSTHLMLHNCRVVSAGK